VAKQRAQFKVCNVDGHVSPNSSHENRNFVSEAIEFDVGEIPANSANRSVVEPVQEFRPLELARWQGNRKILYCGKGHGNEFVMDTNRRVRAFFKSQ
jgi:hypothetical protein